MSRREFGEPTTPRPDPPPLPGSSNADREPVYVYFIKHYIGSVVTTEVRPGLMFDTTPDNRLIGIEILDYEYVTKGGLRVIP